jgi:hypothetical protein
MHPIHPSFDLFSHNYEIVEQTASHQNGGLRGDLKTRLVLKGYQGETLKVAVERLALSGLEAFVQDVIYFFKNLLGKRFVIINTGDERLAINIRSCMERLRVSKQDVLSLEQAADQLIDFDLWFVDRSISNEGVACLYGRNSDERDDFKEDVLDYLLTCIVAGEPLPEFTQESFLRFYFVVLDEFSQLQENVALPLKNNIESLKELFLTDPQIFEYALALLLVSRFNSHDDCPQELLEKAKVDHQDNSLSIVAKFIRLGIFLPPTSPHYNYIAGITDSVKAKGPLGILNRIILNKLSELGSVAQVRHDLGDDVFKAIGVPKDILDKDDLEVLKWLLIDYFKSDCIPPFNTYRFSIYAPLSFSHNLSQYSSNEVVFQSVLALELIKDMSKNGLLLDPSENKNLYLKAGLSEEALQGDQLSFIKAILNLPGLKEKDDLDAEFIKTYGQLFKKLGIEDYKLFRPGLFKDDILQKLL